MSMNCLTEEQLTRITHIIEEIEKLNDVEKLCLYLQLPCGRADKIEGKSKLRGSGKSDLFSKKPDQETTQTYTWILSHLEVDPNVSLPKQEVYEEYRAFCQANRFEPLCVADFGKAMKHAFPCIKPRRLGQRGNSRYCYSGLRKKYKIQAPNLPEMIEPTFCIDNDCSQAYNQIIRDCADNPDECPLNRQHPYEVINLKIEQHGDTQYHSNGNVHYSNGGHLPPNKHHLPPMQTSALPVQGHQHHHNHQERETTSSLATHSVAMQLCNDYTGQAGTSTGHINQPSYELTAGVIQQPGSPDDDDYRHNYQDISMCMSYGRPPLVSSVIPTTISSMSIHGGQPHQDQGRISHHHQQLHHQQQSSFNQGETKDTSVIPHERPVLANRADDCNSSQCEVTQVNNGRNNGNNNTSDDVDIQGETVNENNFSESDIQHPLLALHGGHYDSCASPFQSPASTPYPMMGNYINQDSQNYYSNECIRYP